MNEIFIDETGRLLKLIAPFHCIGCAPFLEKEFYPELRAARVIVLVGSRDTTKCCLCRINHRRREIRLIQGVDELEPYLYPHSFIDPCVFQDRQIEIVDIVPANIAEEKGHCSKMADRRGVCRRPVEDRKRLVSNQRLVAR
jgi:hypothetical protein